MEFDVKIKFSHIYDYMINHVYSSAQGLLGTAVGALLIVMYTMNTEYIIALIFGIVIILYLPGSLYLKAKKQALNPVYKNPLHYRMDDEGMHVSQGEVEQMIEWDNMYKAVSTKTSIILYTSRINASIFPRECLDDKLTELIATISTHMDPKKVKIKY